MQIPSYELVKSLEDNLNIRVTERTEVVAGKKSVIVRLGIPDAIAFMESMPPAAEMSLGEFLKASKEKIGFLKHIRISLGSVIFGSLIPFQKALGYLEIAGSPSTIIEMQESLRKDFKKEVYHKDKPGRISSAFRRTFYRNYRHDIGNNSEKFPPGYTFAMALKEYKHRSKRRAA